MLQIKNENTLMAYKAELQVEKAVPVPVTGEVLVWELKMTHLSPCNTSLASGSNYGADLVVAIGKHSSVPVLGGLFTEVFHSHDVYLQM